MGWFIVFWFCVVFGLIGGLLFWLVSDVNEHHARFESYKQHCMETEGAHLYAPDDIWFCITADGRIVEVFP